MYKITHTHNTHTHTHTHTHIWRHDDTRVYRQVWRPRLSQHERDSIALSLCHCASPARAQEHGGTCACPRRLDGVRRCQAQARCGVQADCCWWRHLLCSRRGLWCLPQQGPIIGALPVDPHALALTLGVISFCAMNACCLYPPSSSSFFFSLSLFLFFSFPPRPFTCWRKYILGIAVLQLALD